MLEDVSVSFVACCESLCDGARQSRPRSVLSLLELFNIAPPLEASGRFLQRSMPGCRLPALASCLCATLSLLHPAVYCARSPFSTFPSPWYQASHSWGARLGHLHSVLGPLSAVHYCTPSQSGWQICSARCPDPALPSPVAGNALATSRVPCPHTVNYMLRSICHLASGPYASRSTLKLRPVYLHLMWCPSTFVQHCAPYTPGWLIAVLDIQASPSQLTHRSLLHTLDGAPATPVQRLHLAKHHFR